MPLRLTALRFAALTLAILSSAPHLYDDAYGAQDGIATDTILAAYKKRYRVQRPTKDPRVAQPAPRVFRTDEQALRAFEIDLSRNVGKAIKQEDYPEEARRWAWSGTTFVQVLVDKDGWRKAVSVSKSSGFRVLDEQALRLIHRVETPPVPQRLRGREIVAIVPIGFYQGQQQ